MHALHRIALVVTALSTLTSSPAAFAHKPNHSFGLDDDFSWAIVSDGGRSISGNLNSDPIGELKKRYRGDFLYIRDGEERWVITDPRDVERARRACERIRDYDKEISEIANAEARFAMAGMKNEKKRAQLFKNRRELEEKIEELDRRGDDTSDLERELFRVKIELDVTESLNRSARISEEERRDLTVRRDRASVRLKKGMQKIQADLRQILEDAKEGGRAERVELD